MIRSPWPARTRRESAALVGVLALATWFRLFHLAQAGFGNAYYAAAARSMLASWHNFFFVSFDPVGFVSVDKPPVALWIQALSARIFGYSGAALLVPQVLEGVAAVALLYAIVRRWSGPGAALLSALALALSPASVATDRCNNVDSCLVLFLLLATAAFLRALHDGSRRWLVASFALIGLGFNTKMLAAFVLLPVLCILYLHGAPRPWRTRWANLLWGSLALLVVSLSWPLAVDLTPADQRPYVGSSQDNSVLGLALGWNGFQRLLGRRTPSTAPREQAPSVPPLPGLSPVTGPSAPGAFRLADTHLAGQFAWLIPLGLLGLIVSASSAPSEAPWLLWAGWGGAYALVFSFMRGTFHHYYLVLLAPPAAALFGAGAWELWERFRASHGRQRWLVLGLVLTAIWQAWLIAQFPQWRWRLLPTLCTGTLAAAVGLMLHTWGPLARPSLFLGVGLTSLFLGPALWSLGAMQSRNVNLEATPDHLATPTRIENGSSLRPAGDPVIARLVDFTRPSEDGRPSALAVPNCRIAAPIIIQTGAPVLALGGFLGSDPIVTVERFAQWVKEGRVRYAIVAGPALPFSDPTLDDAPRPGGSRVAPPGAIPAWIRSNGRLMGPDLWTPFSSGEPPRSVPWGIGLQLYDLSS